MLHLLQVPFLLYVLSDGSRRSTEDGSFRGEDNAGWSCFPLNPKDTTMNEAVEDCEKITAFVFGCPFHLVANRTEGWML